MRIELLIAWPDRCRSQLIELPQGACLADALALATLDPDREAVAHAIHGVVARPQQPLHDGDRIELLRPLLADPKEARRRRARPVR